MRRSAQVEALTRGEEALAVALVALALVLVTAPALAYRGAAGLFSHGDRSLFSGLTGHLLNRDDYLVMADFEAYVDAQRQVSRVWGDPDQWTRMSVLNVSRIGYFSSDRSIAEYAEKIWKVEPTRIPNDLP